MGLESKCSSVQAFRSIAVKDRTARLPDNAAVADWLDPNSKATCSVAVSSVWIGTSGSEVEPTPGSTAVTSAVADKTRRSSNCVTPREIKPRFAFARSALDRLRRKSGELADLSKRRVCHIGENCSREFHDGRLPESQRLYRRQPVPRGPGQDATIDGVGPRTHPSPQYQIKRGCGRRQSFRSGHRPTTTVAFQMVQSDVERSIYIDYLRWRAIATVLRTRNVTIGGEHRI